MLRRVYYGALPLADAGIPVTAADSYCVCNTDYLSDFAVLDQRRCWNQRARDCVLGACNIEHAIVATRDDVPIRVSVQDSIRSMR